ncbi:MAG: glycosyltransferase [Goleter apudmare HA4340-LM2]|jgi:GT2 family glycosyltransferase|nr:glycosyltransferase [Goleter apudmare HA4340-LM2]
MSDVLTNPRFESQYTQTTVKLQNIILPNLDICTTEELFLRLNPQCLLNYEDNSVELKDGGFISFDTYFNSFSIQKWQEHTKVKSIGINLYLQGKFQVKLLNIDNCTYPPKIISQKLVHNPHLDEVTLFDNVDIKGYQGLFYIELRALQRNCLFKGGYFYTDLFNLEKSLDKKLAIVICTYKRESYVIKNIRLLEKHLLSEPESEKEFEIFIIDNGRTLDNFHSSQIHVIPNKNAGGSGGYTRGIIEVLERKSNFSHIIFMDDDVIIYPEIFTRIYNFQSLANNQDLCIGGSMLRLDTKYMQHENGAIWNQEVIRLKPDLDLRDINHVLFNEIEEYISYNGWWLFCFPTQIIDEYKLPYPFFIKMDDMELPMRLKCKIITLNGVCVWHEALENKYSPMMNYYLRRNELIFNVITDDDFNELKVIKRFVKFTLREAFCYRYKSAKITLEAVADFLKGPYYLKTLDPEKKNLEVLSMGEKAVKNYDLPFIYEKYQESIDESESSIHRWLRFITLNGHLLPSFFFHKTSRLIDRGYRVIPMQGYRPVNIFKAQKALYYNLHNREGFVVKFSRTEFFKISMQTMNLAWKVCLRFSQIKYLYKETLPELTNKAFWQRYLEINKYSDCG